MPGHSAHLASSGASWREHVIQLLSQQHLPAPAHVLGKLGTRCQRLEDPGRMLPTHIISKSWFILLPFLHSHHTREKRHHQSRSSHWEVCPCQEQPVCGPGKVGTNQFCLLGSISRAKKWKMPFVCQEGELTAAVGHFRAICKLGYLLPAILLKTHPSDSLLRSTASQRPSWIQFLVCPSYNCMGVQNTSEREIHLIYTYGATQGKPLQNFSHLTANLSPNFLAPTSISLSDCSVHRPLAASPHLPQMALSRGWTQHTPHSTHLKGWRSLLIVMSSSCKGQAWACGWRKQIAGVFISKPIIPPLLPNKSTKRCNL